MDMHVALKEFFVSDFCNRDEKTGQVSVATKSKVELIDKLKKKFMDEARALFKMKHPGIVRVIDVFGENGTAYYAMEYIDGQSLSDVMKKRARLPEAEAVDYIRQVAEALKYVHSLNRLHLDIKPGNIMLGREGKAILIDFGASKHYDDETGENTSTLLGINTKGYAPVEQVHQSFKSFSPATDIYALGATLYKLLTGITPPPSTMLVSEEATLSPLPSTISPSTNKAVESAMQLLRKHRPQTIDAWMQLLSGEASNVNDRDSEHDEQTVVAEVTEVSASQHKQTKGKHKASQHKQTITSHFPELTFVANLVKSITCSEGGKIIIRDDTVSFVPHAFNGSFFSEQERTIYIKDIIGYKKGWLALFTIFVKNREPYKLSIYKKNTIIKELEKRRDYYFQRMNMSTPPLSK